MTDEIGTTRARRVLVTGAARGIGATTAAVLARGGAEVVAADRTMLDVTSTASVRAGVAAAEATVGPLDGLVCNAGVPGPTAPVWQVSEAEWTATLEADLTGVWRCLAAVLPGMVERRRGSVVVIGSVTGLRPLAGRTPYAAAKAGLVGLVRSAALDCRDSGVRINVVTPGPVDGARLQRVLAASGRSVEELFPDRAPVSEQRVAAVVAHLLDDQSSGTGRDITP